MKPLRLFGTGLRLIVCLCVLGVYQVGKLDHVHAQERIAIVNGTVTNETTGRAIAAVSVIYDGSVVTVTDDDGRYEFRLPISDVRIDIAFQRIGFRRHVEARDVPDGGGVLTVDVSLVPIPTVLEEITVDGRQITIRNPGLIGFYERRELGYGRFLTEREIGRAKGFDMSNLFRRLRFPQGCGSLRPFVVYLDGIRVVDTRDGAGGTTGLERINDLVAPSQIGGMELYRFESAVRLPREFIPAGPYCAVAMFWTREPKDPSNATLTAHLGSMVGRGANSRFAVGGGFGFPLRSRSTLRFDASAQVPLERSTDLWRVFIQSTGRLFGQTSPWYIGLGVAVIKPRGSVGGNRVTTVEASPVLVTGLRMLDIAFSPFVELRVLDPTSPNRTSGIVVTGVRLDLGGRS